MNILRKSWHHELFTFGDRNKYESKANICNYVRGVFAGMFLVVVSILLASLVITIIAEPLVSIVAYLITKIAFIPFLGSVLGADYLFFTLGSATYVVFFVIGIVKLVKYLYNYTKNNIAIDLPPTLQSKVQKSADFTKVIALSIKSKHDKFCHNINFTNEK